MKTSTESPGATHLIERQMLLSRVRDLASHRGAKPEPTARYRFITIAREVGAEGDRVATGLSKHLNWDLFDKEIVDFIARDSHVRQDLVLELDERSQSLIHDTVQRLLLMAEGISFGNEEYHEALLKTMAYLAARGNAIIVGRGGAYALRGEPGLHVRVVASPDVRIQRLAKRWGIAPSEARRRMVQVDADRRSFIQRHFRQNLDDGRFYNAVINSDELSIEQVVHAVLGMMHVPEHAAHAEDPGIPQTLPLSVSPPAESQPHQMPR